MIALLLATVGVYGVMSCTVTQQTGEIGIRTALGARRADVLLLGIGQGVRLASIGIATGLAGAFALSRGMTALLYQVSVGDMATFAVSAGVLALAAVGGCLFPALRATRIDPLRALRYE